MPEPTCDLASLVNCDDPDQTITNFIEQKGYITDFVYAGVRNSSPLIRLLEKTKKEFPSGQGDSITRAVLEITSPNELDGLNWNPVRSGFPGSSPCCNEYRDFTYGNRTVSGCLSQIGYRSPSFCKTDIVFKTKFMDQLLQIVMSMQNISTGVWDNWLKNSYPKSVMCVTLSKQWGHPEKLGTYDSAARPTTFMNVEHLDILMERVQSAGGLIGSPIKDYQVIVMGRNSFNRMKRRRMEQNATLVGARDSSFSLPNYAEFSVDGVGKVITFSMYAFVLVDKPRRFRQKLNSESWDDAIVPSTINVNTDRGQKTDRNPDYYNPSIAIFEESLWLNLQAVDWLVPPGALAKDISAGGKTFFSPLNYAGDFEAVYCPEDLKRKRVQFLADFMGGMMSLFPNKGRAVLHLACHIEACDDDDTTCVSGNQAGASDIHAIRWTGITATPGQLNFLIDGELAEACPEGYTLFATTEKGLRYPINAVVSSTEFAGNSTFPNPGAYVVVSFPSGIADVATTRELCDSWKFIECLPNSTPSNTANDNPCGVCNNSTTETTTCTLSLIVVADRITGMKTAAGADFIPDTNYTVAATLQTAINNAIDGTGSEAVVTGGTAADGYEWHITITGVPSLVGAQIMYDDGLTTTNLLDFGVTGVCA